MKMTVLFLTEIFTEILFEFWSWIDVKTFAFQNQKELKGRICKS